MSYLFLLTNSSDFTSAAYIQVHLRQESRRQKSSQAGKGCLNVAQLGVSIALTMCESWALFFVSSQCANFIRLFLCDDASHKLGSKTVLCFNNNIINGEDLAPVKCI